MRAMRMRIFVWDSQATCEALGAIATSSQAPAQRAPKRSSVLFPVRSSSSRRAPSCVIYIYFLCFCLLFSTEFSPIRHTLYIALGMESWRVRARSPRRLASSRLVRASPGPHPTTHALSASAPAEALVARYS
jgi:hypothetical protein